VLSSKYLVGFVLVAVLMATLIPFSTMVYAQNQEKEKAEAFLALAEQSKEKVESLKEFAEAQGIDVPDEADTLYETGSGLLAQAWEAFDGGDYEETIELAKEALWNFREAIKVLNKALGPMEEIEAESEQSALGEAITRVRDRRDRVLDIIDAMLESYPNLDTTGIIMEIKDTLSGPDNPFDAHINAAEDYLAETTPDVDAAAKELGEAHRLISSALVSLKKHVAGELNSERVKDFLTVITNFYNRTTKLVDRAVQQGLLVDPQKTEIYDDLTEVSTLIGSVDVENIDEAVSYLMKARSLLESIQRAIVDLRKGGPKGG